MIDRLENKRWIVRRGRKRRDLEAWSTGPEGPRALFAGRILPFDEAVGRLWAELVATGRASGRPRSALDMIRGRRPS
jgi:hypothetical protein